MRTECEERSGTVRDCPGSRGRAVVRTVALAAAVVCGVLLAAPGCAEQKQILPGLTAVEQPPDIEAALLRIMTNDGRWATMQADCTLTIRSDYLRGEENQVTLQGARLFIRRPGGVRLVLPASGTPQVLLVGDGVRYRADMALFANQHNSGMYGDPLPVDRPRILLMPEDIAQAFNWTPLLADTVHVTREDPVLGRFCVDCLTPVHTPQPRLRLDQTVVLEPRGERVYELRRYNDDGSTRVVIRYGSYKVLMNAADEPIELPTQLWLGYSPGRTSTLIALSRVRLDQDLSPGLFDAGGGGVSGIGR